MIEPTTCSIGEYTIAIGQFQSASQPEAALVLELGDGHDDRVRRDLNVRHASRGNILELAIRFVPCGDSFAWPMALLVSETDTLFVAAGGVIGIYDLLTPREVLQHSTELHWTLLRGPSGVLLIAELELRAWDLRGNDLWDTKIEPPHNVWLRGDDVVVDDADQLGHVRSYAGTFPLRHGPPHGTKPR
jgi:hypothetical protein